MIGSEFDVGLLPPSANVVVMPIKSGKRNWSSREFTRTVEAFAQTLRSFSLQAGTWVFKGAFTLIRVLPLRFAGAVHVIGFQGIPVAIGTFDREDATSLRVRWIVCTIEMIHETSITLTPLLPKLSQRVL